MSLSTEKVFDMLPSFVDLYDKLDIDGYRNKIAKDNKGKNRKDATTLGIDLFKYILKNSKNIKEECFEIVSVLDERPIEEIKTQSFMITINSIKDIFDDKDAIDFFKLAIQSEDTEKA